MEVAVFSDHLQVVCINAWFKRLLYVQCGEWEYYAVDIEVEIQFSTVHVCTCAGVSSSHRCIQISTLEQYLYSFVKTVGYIIQFDANYTAFSITRWSYHQAVTCIFEVRSAIELHIE